MIIRVTAFIDVDTGDPEGTCNKLDEVIEQALDHSQRSYGEIISANVDYYRALSPGEIKEFGYESE